MARGAAAALLLALGLPLLGGCAPEPIAACAAEDAAQICGFAKPEDLVRVPGAEIALVIEHGDAKKAAGFSLLDLKTATRSPLPWKPERDEAIGAADCAGPPEKFAPGGIDLAPDGSRFRVAAVNRAVPSRIEFFELVRAGEGFVLSWAGCVAVAAGLFLNDVALGQDGRIFATHMVDPEAARAALAPVRFFFGFDTGYVVGWSREDGWSKVQGSEGSFPNGIALSPAGDALYFAETFGERVNRIDLADGRRTARKLGFQPDNLTWSDEGALIAAGHDGLPLLTTRGCRTIADAGCGFSFRVVRVAPDLGAAAWLFRSDGQRIPGASTALVDHETIWLGTAFGDRVTRVTSISPRGQTPRASH